MSDSESLQHLKMYQERLDLCLSAGNLAWWEMDCQTGKVIFNENKVKMLGYDMNDFQDVTFEAFTELLHPDDYEMAMQAMQDHLSGKKDLYEIEYRIKAKNGVYKWFYDRGSIVERDSQGNPAIIKGIVFDITDRKHSEEALKQSHLKLEQTVEERTEELSIANKKLRDEIDERKQAEEYTNRTKEYLKNVINSATEIILAFDFNNRITIWNKTAEYLTGYKDIEVLNRGVKKLLVFENASAIIELLNQTCESEEPLTSDVILLTKQQNKRIMRMQSSPIIGRNKECIGTILMGTDITRDTELHGKLISGCNYLITQTNVSPSIDLLVDLSIRDHSTYLITRTAPAYLKNLIPRSTSIQPVLLTQKSFKEFETIADLDVLTRFFESKCKNNSAFLLDGLHYLITLFSFEDVLKSLFTINEIIASTNSLFFLQVDTNLLSDNQVAILKNEFIQLPSQNVEDLIIDDELYNILKYIYQENKKNMKVSIKKLTQTFHMTYPTVKVKLDGLLSTQLIYVKREGKLKNIYTTDKGKMLLHKRLST